MAPIGSRELPRDPLAAQGGPLLESRPGSFLESGEAFAWFKKTYPGVDAECVIVIPPKTLGAAASLLQPTKALQKGGIDKLCKNVRAFFGEFLAQGLQDLSAAQVQKALERHTLGVDHLLSTYSSPIKSAGLP